MRNIVILGSTGSIGTQALQVIDNDVDINVLGLCVNSSIEELREQVIKYKPRAVCVYDEEAYKKFKEYKFSYDLKIYTGMSGLKMLSSLEDADDIIVSVVGMIGIEPTIEALKAGKRVLLANKETLVCAGHIIMPLAEKMGNPIRPIDSEHSAIWQSLASEDSKAIERILLTASGGPFRNKTFEEMKLMKKEDALKHPNWSMGRKITIDSASMVNKGLEVIEAKWLFDVEPKNITVVIQPESILHSAVEFIDGSIKGQFGLPDMKIPIEYALYAPSRRYIKGERLDLFKLSSINFEKPDTEKFKGLKLAYKAISYGSSSMPTVYNAANEEAVALFLQDKIGFTEIADVIEKAMDIHFKNIIMNPSVSEILMIEKKSRNFVRESFKS